MTNAAYTDPEPSAAAADNTRTDRRSAFPLDPASWLERALHLLALRLRHEVALTRALRGDERREGFLGVLMSDAEAERMVDEMSGRLVAEGGIATVREIDQARNALTAERQSDPDCIWARLADSFDLAEPELEILVLAAAPALDPRFGRVYGYLNDDMSRRYLTPALAQRLAGAELDALTLRRVLADGAPLIAFGLLRAEAMVPVVERALRIDEGLLDQLIGGEVRHDGAVLRLGACARPARSLVVAGSSAADTSLAVLEAARARQWDLCLLSDCHDPERLRLGVRSARLEGLVPVVTGVDTAEPQVRRMLAPILSSGTVLVTGMPDVWTAAGVCAEIQSAEPSSDSVRRDWAARLAGEPTTAALTALLANARHLDLLKVATAAASADTRALEIAVRAQLTAGLSSFAQPIDTTKTLDDLVLPQASRTALERVITWPSASATLLDEWRMGDVFDKRPGLVALFKGPSGTGKTMAAAVVAAALGLPAFRVNLAATVSKYIGETEKNLDRLFSAAEETDALLLIDEADAVFGRRSEVSDAHDRYANLETAYLLQRLETFEGISVLATNLAQNIDNAFLRRIDMVVEFPAPDAAHRFALWRRATRTSAPMGDDLDLETIAERFELTGGEIRNCWLDAGHRAVSAGKAIGMDELMQAIGTELVKQGKPLRRADFGAHYPLLKGSWP